MYVEFTFNLKLLFILVFPIFREIEKIFSDLFLKKNNEFFNIFRISLSNEFSFIFLLIFKCKNKPSKRAMSQDENEKKEDESSFKLLEIEINKIKKKNKIKSILFLFLLSILFFGSSFFNYYEQKRISDVVEAQ